MARRGGIVERRIKAQAGDDGDRHGQCDAPREQAKGGVAAVGDRDNRAIGPPTPHDKQELPRPIGERFMPFARCGIGAFGGGEGGQERECPSAQRAPGFTHGIGASSISETQRSPVALTKWLWLERTASR